jgi:hypothetical protein
MQMIVANHAMLILRCRVVCAVEITLGLLLTDSLASRSKPGIGLSIPAGSIANRPAALYDQDHQT